jgi:hypothetical protein
LKFENIEKFVGKYFLVLKSLEMFENVCKFLKILKRRESLAIQRIQCKVQLLVSPVSEVFSCRFFKEA